MKSSGYSPGQGFSPEKATALRQILQKKGTAKVKPDPELAKSKSELVKKSSEPPKSKELVQALKITETKAKQSLAFEAKTEAPKVPESKLSIVCLICYRLSPTQCLVFWAYFKVKNPKFEPFWP